MGLLTACVGGQLDPRPDISFRLCLGFEIRVKGGEEKVQVMRKLCLLALVWAPLAAECAANDPLELAGSTLALLCWLAVVPESRVALACLLHFLEAILQVGVVQSLSSSHALCGRVFKEVSEEVHCKLRAQAAVCNCLEHGMFGQFCMALGIHNVATLQWEQGAHVEQVKTETDWADCRPPMKQRRQCTKRKAELCQCK